MTDPGLPAVLTGQHDPAAAGVPVGWPRAERRLVVELVIRVILERAVRVDGGFRGELVGPYAGVVVLQRLAERVAGPLAESGCPGQVDRVAGLRLGGQAEPVPY